MAGSQKKSVVKPNKNTKSKSSIFHDRNLNFARQWISLFFKISLVLIIVNAGLELVMFFVSDWAGIQGTSGLWQYLWKYFLVPSGCNFLLFLIAFLISKKASTRVAALTSCLLLVGIVFVAYSVHSVFPIIQVGFIIAILMSTIYGSERITLITFIASIILKIVSDIFIDWDADVPNRVLSSETALVNFYIALLCIIATYVVARVFGGLISRFYANEERQYNALYIETLTDSLTGIRNRSAFRMELDTFLKDNKTAPCCLAMVDIDHFKPINDTYGHQVGDQYLCALARVLNELPDSIAFRYGGDEFSILFPGKDSDEALTLLKAAAADFYDSMLHTTYIQATFSAGIAQFDAENETIADFVHRADKTLYRAKEQRNTICVYDAELDIVAS